ncbi:DUF2254 domain-containing protein [Pseudomonas psychrophila]|uniref:Uncharacterized membrane protein n=1 Tax=Pseudomonas psychrophila TaxID=122355 RepID=A0ABY0VQM3_9PSED|nr:DUF2254 domain-containing protein [Pseudomonas psychrophila]KAB0486016.1 DUF2254 domain-containing protein [Pseudomonas psychrophila]KMN02520.1 hypothetical protein TU76_01690 [Pseudomonas psychrophila]QIE32512.1 DUF2254 domain-containing protein [Pseudomonas psychrophila]WVI99059.1 DUF2254 domain-containing protein [Pseudomonas psychrophila]SDU49548.1 Uncharacterized membrane protein [Pseudomonas psychrophila]
MIARWRWVTNQLTKRLWFRASLFSLLGVATALAAVVFKDFIPESLSARIGADAVDKILGIIASSMLAVTTFSLSTMVTAYGAASSGVTPRATTLVMEDTTTQNALATFIGSFLFSLVGIIALSTGAYGTQGRVLLFAVTIGVVVLIVYTLLRWIDHLSKLGRVGETIDRVEKAAIEAISQRVQWPYLGGSVYPTDLVLPLSAIKLASDQTGYVQHIDVSALGVIAQEEQIQIYLTVLPGTFVHEGMPLLQIVSLGSTMIDDISTARNKIRATLTIGTRRTFDNDPRFGLCVLSEIASRALSPAVNDPGTAIDVIGRGVRTLTCWSKPQVSSSNNDQGCKQVFLRGLTVDDLFDDFFAPISRDGAALLEVNLRLLKALISLAKINPAIFKDACIKHTDLLIARADTALALQNEKDQLSSLAKTMYL